MPSIKVADDIALAGYYRFIINMIFILVQYQQMVSKL